MCELLAVVGAGRSGGLMNMSCWRWVACCVNWWVAGLLCELCVAVSISGWLVFGWGIHGFVFAGWCWWDGMAQAVRADWVVSCVDWL